MNWLSWLAARLSEPSTFAGVGVFAATVAQLDPSLAFVAHVVAAGAGAVAVAMSEGAKAAVKAVAGP